MEADVARLPQHPLRLADLPNRSETAVTLVPDEGERTALAEALDLLALRKVRFDATLRPSGKRDWTLEGHLGATVVQPCVVTLAPVTTRIDERVDRRYLAEFVEPDAPEVEMPEDDSAEALPAVLDLGEVLLEALSLALPPYPRADGAETGEAVFTEPGKTPMTDDDTKPFAGLSGLRDKLTGEDGN